MGYYKKVIQNIWGPSGALKKVHRSAPREWPGPPWTDNFTSINTNYWTPSGTVSINGGTNLRISNLGSLQLKTSFAGDFDVWIPFNIISGPGTSAWAMGLNIWKDNNNQALITRQYNGTQWVVVTTTVGGTQQQATAVHSSSTGSLRLRRVGSTMYGYRSAVTDGTTWELLHSRTGMSGTMVVIIMGTRWSNNPAWTGDVDSVTFWAT